MMRRFLMLSALAIAAGAYAQQPSQVNLPARGGPASGDQAVYRAKCGVCHLAGGTGTLMLARRVPREQAQLEYRPDLEADYVKAVVRNGIASMPSITRVEVTDGELQAIARYLSGRKVQGKAAPEKQK